MIVVSILVVIVLIAVLGGYGYLRYRFDQVRKLGVAGLTTGNTSQPMNILLVGDNSRSALNGKQAAFFGSGTQVGGGRADVIMVLHLDPAAGTASVLSIPRDLFLPIPGKTGAMRIDDNLNSGPSALVRAVQQDLGIPINHYIELNFDSFQNVVNALGGINMQFPNAVKDAYTGLNVQSPGCYHLNGLQALQVVRSRHMYYRVNGVWHYDGLGDLSRIKRDHEFLRVLLSSVLKQGLTNPATANAIVGKLVPQMQVDSSFSLSTMLQMVQQYSSLRPSAIKTATLPVTIANGYVYRGTNFGDVVLPSQPGDQQLIHKMLSAGTTPAPLPSPSSIHVQVLNGSGLPSQAADTAQLLAKDGFQISGVGNATVTAQPAETVVRYAAGQKAAAERLVQSLSGQVGMGQVALDPVTVPAGTNLVLVTGTNLTVSVPHQAATPPVTSSSGVSAPPATAAHTSLPFFDPRACPAGATPRTATFS